MTPDTIEMRRHFSDEGGPAVEGEFLFGNNLSVRELEKKVSNESAEWNIVRIDPAARRNSHGGASRIILKRQERFARVHLSGSRGDRAHSEGHILVAVLGAVELRSSASGKKEHREENEEKQDSAGKEAG